LKTKKQVEKRCCVVANHPLSIALASGFYRPVVSIGANDTLNKPMPDNITLRQFDNAYTLNSAEPLYCLNHTASLAQGQVYLGYIACDNHFRAASQPGQNHKHLKGRGVLRLIADYQ
jgi:hypothetical protein